MSNYGSVPPPGPYTPPNASTPGYNAQQQPNHPPSAPNQGPQGHAHKTGGFGSMMNQAVTTGKPMLNKLSKTISSKLAGKPAAGPPQHLQSYQNYQQHHGQGQGLGQQSQPHSLQQQYQGQSYSPQPQQQQWAHPQQPSHAPPPQAPGAYGAQQSPFQQSNYATPNSGHSGQSNYFPAQPPPTAPPLGAPGYNSAPFSAGGPTGSEPQVHTPQGQPQGQYQHAQQGQYGQQGQPGQQSPNVQQGYNAQQGQHEQQGQNVQQGQYPGQQTGVVGSAPSSTHLQSTQPSHMGDVSPEIPPNKPAMQTQWGLPSGSEQLPPPGAQQQAHLTMPPQQQSYGTTPSQQPYQTLPSPISHDQQQWKPASPVTTQGHSPAPPPPVSPPPQQTHSQPPPMSNVSSQPTQPPTPVPQHALPETGPTEFIAELPADFGNMSPAESKVSNAQYQAYHPTGGQSGSPTNRFSVPRRALSASSLPLADPWRIADPITEQPTREFYIVADLLFDALDRKFEPQNTGLLEAPKVLRSWIDLVHDAYQLFSHNNYTAVARMWSLEGIPHVMVPVQPSLTPVWNFNQHSHAQHLKIIAESQSTYATYMPALNRAGWYKFFFLEMIAGSDDLGKLLTTLCADTYKPGVLNHPDLNRRDTAEIPGLKARAAEVQGVAIRRVCEEAKASLDIRPTGSHGAQQAQADSADQIALMMHEIQMASNDIAVRSVADGEFVHKPAEGQTGGYSRLV